MQTFLPYPSFHESARCLDRRRLGKQRVEVKQILLALGHSVGPHQPSSGWSHHPIVKLWAPYPWHLAAYGVHICNEWISRGYKDSLLPQFLSLVRSLPYDDVPHFIGNHAFHQAMKSNLIRKKPEHYRPIFGPDVPDDLHYIFPTRSLTHDQASHVLPNV